MTQTWILDNTNHVQFIEFIVNGHRISMCDVCTNQYMFLHTFFPLWFVCIAESFSAIKNFPFIMFLRIHFLSLQSKNVKEQMKLLVWSEGWWKNWKALTFQIELSIIKTNMHHLRCLYLGFHTFSWHHYFLSAFRSNISV